VITAAAGILPIAISASCGALAMILTGCLTWRDATRALSVQVIMIVAASLALGAAMLKTGAADYLARCFLALSGEANPRLIFAGLMLMIAVLTNVVSNNAAAVIGTPIGISIARQLGLNPEPFVLAVLFGANMSFITPMAYKTNLLIMNAGGYRFSDFVRVGTPLTVIALLAFSWILPLFYRL
jgi:di/tricarboxylate transporter